MDLCEVQWNFDLVLCSLKFSFKLCALSVLCYISTFCLYITVHMCEISSVSRLDDRYISNGQDFFFSPSREISSRVRPARDPVSTGGFFLKIK